MNLGRYEVVRELGKGAMGIVYLAKDPLIGRLVALKTIRIPAADDEEAQEYQQRFVREAQAAGILSHPSIVTVHDIGQDEPSGTSYIAMEFIEGPNLKEILQQGREVRYDEVAESIAQVAEALDYAHTKGIVHRDVKPANILFCDGGRVKITDFGIAKIASVVSNLTSTGQFIGTPNYMSPEQVKGTPVDGRTDLFALGIVLYEWLTKRKPFGGDSLTTISYKIVHEGTQPLREIDPGIPAGFEAVVTKCLAKDPALRFQRGKDLAAALRGVMRASDPRIDAMQLEQTVAVGATRDDMPFEAAGEIPSTSGPLSGSLPRNITKPVPLRRWRKPIRIDWRKVVHASVPAWLFFLVILAALAAFGLKSLSIWRQRVTVPVVDTKREQLVKQQRELRLEGARLLRAGQVEAAYAKFRQLLQLAPGSPAVKNIVAKLEQIRTQQQISVQRKAEAATKFEEGKKLYEKRDYAKAIKVFEEAFYLDPTSEESINYLRMSREQLGLQGGGMGEEVVPAQNPGRSGRQTRAVPRAAPARGTAVSGPAANVTLTVDTRYADGYVVVKMGGETVLHENLWQEGRGLIRRKQPRQIQLQRELRPGTYDVEAWLIVPSTKVNERRLYRFTIRPGADHTIRMSVDANGRAFNVTFR